MAAVTVTPETFELINFSAEEIIRVAGEVADAVGLGADVPVSIAVEEAAMVARTSSRVEGDGVVVEATGGAFESLRKAREFDEVRCRSILGQALLRARDRLDPAFGDPAEDAELPVQLEVAWATYIEGRLHRLGVIQGRPQRRIYHFRVRHGFNDTVDRIFEGLWSGQDLTWADIRSASEEAAGSTVSA